MPPRLTYVVINDNEADQIVQVNTQNIQQVAELCLILPSLNLPNRMVGGFRLKPGEPLIISEI